MSEEKRPYSQLEEDWNTLRRKHLALIVATQKLNDEMTEHRKHSIFCDKQLVNADKNVAIQKKITADSIKQNQELTDNLVAEIVSLKAIIKQLKG